jgi:acetyl-CoA acetyltransferase
MAVASGTLYLTSSGPVGRQCTMGPVPATRKVLDRTGIKLDEIDDVFEVNEAFAAQALASRQGSGPACGAWGSCGLAG